MNGEQQKREAAEAAASGLAQLVGTFFEMAAAECHNDDNALYR
jgi:hypothetical protein